MCRDEVEENFLDYGEFQIEEYGIQTIAAILSPKKTATKPKKTTGPKPKKLQSSLPAQARDYEKLIKFYFILFLNFLS